MVKKGLDLVCGVCLPLHVEGCEADSDDSGVWSHMGGWTSPDCCEPLLQHCICIKCVRD